MRHLYVSRVEQFLQDGEKLEDVELVTCVATGAGLGGGLSAAVGNLLSRVSAVNGEPGSVARLIPYQRGGIVFGVTDRRVGLWSGKAMGAPRELWSAPRGVVARVERRPRLQFLARFRLHFADGSSAAFMTASRANIERLADLLGR